MERKHFKKSMLKFRVGFLNPSNYVTIWDLSKTTILSFLCVFYKLWAPRQASRKETSKPDW